MFEANNMQILVKSNRSLDKMNMIVKNGEHISQTSLKPKMKFGMEFIKVPEQKFENV